jgi:hypothetical protein
VVSYSSFGVFSCLALIACSSNTVINNGADAGSSGNASSSGTASSSGAASSSSSSSSSTGGSSSVPASGVWFYDQVERTADTCHAPQIKDPSGDFTIQDGAGGSFVITPGDGTDPFTCTASGGKFTCPNRAAQKTNVGTAVISGQATASGTVVSDAKLNGSQDLQVTCAGSDCSAVAAQLGTSFPCTISITFTAVKR